MAAERDCGGQTCTMDYRFVSNCVEYVDKDGICDYPCSFDHCASELHHLIMCPVWSCAQKTTTTSAPSDISTLSPLPTKPSLCSSEICVPSVVFNVLFAVTFLGLASFIWIRRKRSQSNGIENPFFDDAEYGRSTRPIIRNSERLPLLTNSPRPQAVRRASNPAPDGATPSGSASLPNFYQQVAEAFLPHPSRSPSSWQETTF